MKIITRMLGGLGNQLFILSYAINLAMEHGFEESEIVLDLREYEKYKTRDFELSSVIDGSFIREYASKDGCIIYDLSRKLYHLAQHFFRSETWKDNLLYPLSKIGLYYSGLNVSKYNRHITSEQIYVYGYFQSSQIAFNTRNLLINMLGLKKDNKSFDKRKPYIAISVRCGNDYVNDGWKVYETEYYRNGIKEIILRKEYENVGVLIFSDDINRAKEMSICEDAIYIENKTPIEQLQYMYNCNDYIISNSSFSWWGAVLGMSDNSIVIAPEIWYHSDTPTIETQLYFKQMIIMK